MTQPILRGKIDAEGVVPVLTEVEAHRVTGILTFNGANRGEVRLVLGQISADQEERADGNDVVELLLEERDARYEVVQQLPPLSVSRGDRQTREGSLEVHVPADLMNYCERAGLTGVLELESNGRRAEIGYDKGELHAIRLDGANELHEVFGWDEGSFVVEARNQVPSLDVDPADESMDETRPFVTQKKKVASSPPDSTGRQFLKVVEFTLSDILKEREERRPATRTSPPQPPMPKVNAHASLPPAKKRAVRDDQTVRVIYLGGRESRPLAPSPEPTTAPPKDNAMAKADSQAEPKSASSGAKADSGAEASDDKVGPTWMWVIAVIICAFAALLLLSALPPMG